MTLRQTLIGLGVLIALLPYLGFPSWIDTTLYTLAGLAIIVLLTMSKKEGINHKVSEEKHEAPLQPKNEPKMLKVKRGAVDGQHSLRMAKEMPTEKTP